MVWLASNKLKEGILFQRPVYFFALLQLIGVVLSEAAHRLFPKYEKISLVPLFFCMAVGAWTLHQALLRKVNSRPKCNVAVFVLCAVLVAVFIWADGKQ